MSVYMFRTTATMKEYNRRQWWITPDIIRTKHITADNLREALQAYADSARADDYITISPNALRSKSAMYVDTKEGTPRQVGYVITASTEMQREDGSWTTQFIDLWVSVDKLESVNFKEAI